MKYYIVGAGCGDPGLITVKGMDLLKRAEILIYAGSLVNPELVAASPAQVKLDSWGMKLEEITGVIEEGVRAGRFVVRLHSGDPAIYGSIVEQIAPLEAKGIHAEIIPGVSSKGYWDAIHNNILNLPSQEDYVYFSPHYHIIHWGTMPNTTWYHDRTKGWVYKITDHGKPIPLKIVIKDGQPLEDQLRAKITYLASHAGLFKTET